MIGRLGLLVEGQARAREARQQGPDTQDVLLPALRSQHDLSGEIVSWQYTVTEAIQWRMTESYKPGARKLGDSTRYTLLRLQRTPIAAKVIAELKPGDLVDHCRARISGGAKPATVNGDITCLRSTLRDFIETNELPHEWLLVFAKSNRRLQKEQLIGKSQRRDRLPEDIEIELLLDYFGKQNAHPRCETDMVLVVWGELLTSRRISELCRIERQHVNVEKRTYMVYDLKNSKGKGYHGEAALIEGAWELFERRLAEIPDKPTARLFPFNSKTCSQRYTLAKKKLQLTHPNLFKNLRMHDNRAECCVRLLDKGYSPLQVTKGVSLHLDITTMTQRYARIKAIDLHKGPVGTRATP
jgi:integrase